MKKILNDIPLLRCLYLHELIRDELNTISLLSDNHPKTRYKYSDNGGCVIRC